MNPAACVPPLGSKAVRYGWWLPYALPVLLLPLPRRIPGAGPCQSWCLSAVEMCLVSGEVSACLPFIAYSISYWMASFPSPAHFHLCSSFRQCLEDVQSSLLWRESNFICPLPRWIFRVHIAKLTSLDHWTPHLLILRGLLRCLHPSPSLVSTFWIFSDIFHTLPSHSCCLTNHY